MTPIHYDEAKDHAEQLLRQWMEGRNGVSRVLLIADLLGKLRVILWSTEALELDELREGLSASGGAWWSGDIFLAEQEDVATREFYNRIWASGSASTSDSRYMFIGRHRSRTAWFEQNDETVWITPDGGPPVIVFYSFKGGLGRTTALTSFAVQRAQAGERVSVLDFDLDSPGIGLVLSANPDGVTAFWGVVDFLLEHRTAALPFSDYYHRCDRVSGSGEITVIPAGALDEIYLDKLARVDFEEAPTLNDSGISALLTQVKNELKPHWILVDARTGISEPAMAQI